jgi:cytochrome c553
MTRVTMIVLLSAVVCAPALGAPPEAAASLLSNYTTEGAGPFDGDRGRVIWTREGQQGRTCASCHGEDLTRAGEHIRTKKRIEPLAPSANPERLTDEAKIRKWLYRNCKWTFGRECTPAEKGDVLTFISQE